MSNFSLHNNLQESLQFINTARMFATDANLPTTGQANILYIVEESESTDNKPAGFVYKNSSYVRVIGGMSSTTSVSNLEILQMTKLNIVNGDDGTAISSTNPKTYIIEVEYDEQYKRPKTSILKFEEGTTGELRVESTFDNSDSDDFTYDDTLTEFTDTVMKPVLEKPISLAYDAFSGAGFKWNFTFGTDLLNKWKNVNLPMTVVNPNVELLLSSFSTIHYVSPTGSDSTGDGSEGNPYGTFNYARDLAATGECVYLMEGEHILTSSDATSVSYGDAWFYCSDDITIIGEPWKSKIILDCSSGPTRRYGIELNNGTVINLTFEYTNYYSSTNYENPMFGDGMTGGGVLKNCLFVGKSNLGLYYDNSAGDLSVDNCSIIYTSYKATAYSGGATWTNCETIYVNSLTTENFTAITCVERPNTTLEYSELESYMSTIPSDCINAGTGENPDGSTAHVGVYGGTYAWPEGIVG